MDLGFVGSDELTIDAKGRVSIPASFRGQIQEEDPDFGEGVRARLVIVFGGEEQNHFKVYTIRTYLAIRKKIATKPRGTPKRRALDRTFVSQAAVVSLIEDGRIQLTQKMREKLDLKDKVTFIAESDKFLMYKPEVYQAEEARIDAWIAAQSARLGAEGEFDPEALLDDEIDSDLDLDLDLE